MSSTASLLLKLNTLAISKPEVDELVKQYGADIPYPQVIHSEIERWGIMHPEVRNAESMTAALDVCDKELFPNIHTLLLIGATLPVTTCECERSFSTLRRLNNYLRRTQHPFRLDSLALINIHCDTDVDTERVIDLFSALHPRRMELSTVVCQGLAVL